MSDNDDFSANVILLVFGANIEKARKKKNLSKKELARLTNYDRGSLGLLEMGGVNVEFSTAVKLAQVLDVSFPALFSRNFMVQDENSGIDFAGRYYEDDFLLVFIANFKRELKKFDMLQVNVTDVTDLNEQMVSRLIKGVNRNPTLKTLYACAYTVNAEMYDLFSRKK